LKHYTALFCLIACSGGALAQETPPAAAVDTAGSNVAPVQSILVVGQRPGPALWKVSKGDHLLWVFGTYSPLPKNMVWRSQEVENALAQSQEILGEPGSMMQVGWASSFNLLTAAPFMIGLKDNANGAHLQDVVPADVYARWSVLRTKYMGGDTSLESQRPMFAASGLFTKALAANGMDRGLAIPARIEELAKNWKIKQVSTTVMVDLDNPREAVRDFKKAQLNDLDCFTKTVDRLEGDLDAMKVRANAWSLGDINAIRKLSFPDQKKSCNAAILDSKWLSSLKNGGDLQQRVKLRWLESAEKSLATNRSTFAMLPMWDLLDPQGLVAALRAKGYQVDEPE
jgi:uncharacterized protein YbaP (TraB family)